jgi:hypothetical protein
VNNLSDHFRTAGVMAHMLRHKPDGYEAECAALLARTEGETRARVQAYLAAGVAPVVIEALMGRGRFIDENIAPALVLQRGYGASGAAALLNELPASEEPLEKTLRDAVFIKARQLGMTHMNSEVFKAHIKKLSRVTLDERRAKRRERRGR